MDDLKGRLKALRKAKGLSMEKLAGMVGTQQSRISDIESGNGYIKADDLPKYAEALGTTVSYLLVSYDPENEMLSDLGLSNDTLNKIRQETNLSREHYIQKTIDYLVSYPPVLLRIYCYLTADYQEVETPDKHFSVNDLERIDRLSVLDELEVLRVKMKGANSNETGKR